ncbi:hypothetical protein LOK49_LG03G03140 [Camellia lanceoleosa]|uniref:Uncharacterized protein n=1 Tax=Camellia lanceoleosa TaxID=1840588 RepID=A0ACC0I8L1_9ERIC|nr:hypothetical protein LOK49_LG03G03140 [Camellia lanceoleosa]
MTLFLSLDSDWFDGEKTQLSDLKYMLVFCYKLDLVEYCFGLIYGTNANKHIQRVRNGFVDLFYEYRSDSSDSISSVAFVSENSSSSGSQLLAGSSKQENLAGFHKWYVQKRASNIYA